MGNRTFLPQELFERWYMTATLWVDSDRDKTIELGGTFPLYRSFKELSDRAGGFSTFVRDYPDLSGIITQVESQEDADREWLLDVKAQAAKFLEKYKDRLSDNTKMILEQLIGYNG